jgi:hypothetical protein
LYQGGNATSKKKPVDFVVGNVAQASSVCCRYDCHSVDPISISQYGSGYETRVLVESGVAEC